MRRFSPEELHQAVCHLEVSVDIRHVANAFSPQLDHILPQSQSEPDAFSPQLDHILPQSQSEPNAFSPQLDHILPQSQSEPKGV